MLEQRERTACAKLITYISKKKRIEGSMKMKVEKMSEAND